MSRPKRKAWCRVEDDIPSIWDDKNPQITIIQHRLELAKLHEWNNGRVAELAKNLNTTVWILCAWAGAFKHSYDERTDMFRLVLDKPMIRQAWKENMWPILLVVQFERFEKLVHLKQKKRHATLLSQPERIAATEGLGSNIQG